MHFSTLQTWLDQHAAVHPDKINLGLTRCQAVAQRLDLLSPKIPVITVAGTNGKGSSVAFLEAIFTAAGYRVGCYTSPHLLRFTERIRLAGEEVTDTQLCDIFNLIEETRGDITLTFFEFFTLAALWLFQHNPIDIAILEVGLGGRLDAVNIIDADIALITQIDLDHTDFLGTDREKIGLEKAGIFRPQRPAICSDSNPPYTIIAKAQQLQTQLYCINQDFSYIKQDDSWTLTTQQAVTFTQLPLPNLLGEHQFNNAAGAIMAAHLLSPRLTISQTAIATGLTRAKILGRFQIIPGEITQILDVAHNPSGVAVLKQLLQQQPCQGKTIAVIGILKHKDINSMLATIKSVIDQWYIGNLSSNNTASAEDLQTCLQTLQVTTTHTYSSIIQAYTDALAHAQPTDRIVVFGSFLTVAEVLANIAN